MGTTPQASDENKFWTKALVRDSKIDERGRIPTIGGEAAEKLMARLVAGLQSAKEFTQVAGPVTQRLAAGKLLIAFAAQERSLTINSERADTIILDPGPRGMDKTARSKLLAGQFLRQLSALPGRQVAPV